MVKQSGLFGDTYEPARDEPKPPPKGEPKTQLKMFATDGLPGQLDFLGEMPGSTDTTKESDNES